jgi:cell division protease FtsH
MQLPTGDVLNRNKGQLEARLCVCMAGRIGELKYTNQLSTGARNDIEQATELARAMVCDYGMSYLGPLSFGRKDEQIFLGREIAQHRDYSEATAIEIDKAVKQLVEDAYAKADGMIKHHDAALQAIAQALLVRESIDGEEVKALIEGKPAGSEPSGDEGHQQVIRPEPIVGRSIIEGENPQPA